jgi:hypothetical protein
MTTYRNFEITHSYMWGYDYTHVDYDGPEDSRTGTRHTIEECKDAIDEYYFEKTSYKVLNPNSKTITKFDYWEEAVAFCRSCCIPVDFIKLEIAGFNVDFDSV